MENENLFWCESIEELSISEGGEFFKPEDGVTKIRFLAWPLIYWESQEFNDEKKPVWDKNFYSDWDKKIKSDKFAKLVLAYIIYDYSTSQIKTWTIQTKGLQKTIQAINGLNPNLSLFDCNLTKKKGSNGFYEYQLATWQAKPFIVQEVIDEWKKENPFNKFADDIAEKIETTANRKNLDDEEKEIEAEIASKKITSAEAEAVFE